MNDRAFDSIDWVLNSKLAVLSLNHGAWKESDRACNRNLASYIAKAKEYWSDYEKCPEQLKAHQQQLDEWLTQSGSNAIHDLAKWLNKLGLKLTVRVDRPVNGKCSMNGVDLSEISGNVTNTIAQLQNTDRPHASELADLLTQLQMVINADTNLSNDDKALALEQTQSLAEAAKDPQNGTLRKSAKLAIGFFKGMVVALPATATLVEAVNKLLPTIVARLGL
jgi:hypothetical protein